LHDLYVAEVFLSLDAPEAGLQYLQEQIARPAQTTVEQLSAELALSQVLLVAGRRDEYVRLCSQRIFPAVRLAWNPANGANPAAAAGTIGGGENLVLQMAGQLALLPLAYPEFLAGVSEEVLLETQMFWQTERPRVTESIPGLGLDLFLRAAAVKAGNQALVQEIESRLAANPAVGTTLGDKSIPDFLRENRRGLRPDALWR
ncbi:MAG: hypothetical protein JSS02_33020, partial [Planctomycetes bacterium]|nr:hypothetical protein [Planctomycetota bacterium]